MFKSINQSLILGLLYTEPSFIKIKTTHKEATMNLYYFCSTVKMRMHIQCNQYSTDMIAVNIITSALIKALLHMVVFIQMTIYMALNK